MWENAPDTTTITRDIGLVNELHRHATAAGHTVRVAELCGCLSSGPKSPFDALRGVTKFYSVRVWQR